MSLVKTVFLTDIAKGMALTLKTMFTKPVTRQYPTEERIAEPGYRGLHALLRDEQGNEKCIGCVLCAAACPSRCIEIYTSETPDHKKVVDVYEINLLRCVFCGFCVEACPVEALSMTQEYELSCYDRESALMTKEKLLEVGDRNKDKPMFLGRPD